MQEGASTFSHFDDILDHDQEITFFSKIQNSKLPGGDDSSCIRQREAVS